MQKHDDELSQGFSAGNYAQAYDGLPPGRALKKAAAELATACDTTSKEFGAAFLLGWCGTHSERELKAEGLWTDYVLAHRQVGARLIELGVALEPLEPLELEPAAMRLCRTTASPSGRYVTATHCTTHRRVRVAWDYEVGAEANHRAAATRLLGDAPTYCASAATGGWYYGVAS